MEPQTYVTLCFRSLIYITSGKTRVFRTRQVPGIQRQKENPITHIFSKQLTWNNSDWRGFFSSETYHEHRSASALDWRLQKVWQKTKTKFYSKISSWIRFWEWKGRMAGNCGNNGQTHQLNFDPLCKHRCTPMSTYTWKWISNRNTFLSH